MAGVENGMMGMSKKHHYKPDIERRKNHEKNTVNIMHGSACLHYEFSGICGRDKVRV